MKLGAVLATTRSAPTPAPSGPTDVEGHLARVAEYRDALTDL